MKKKTAGKRVWVYRFIAVIVIPVLFILAIEMGLRIAGYGIPTAAVITYNWNGKTAYCDNYKFTWRFFPRPIAREVDPFIFLKPKPAGTYRIFVVGGSAAQGVPDGAFSFSRVLRVMLSEAYPGTDFEVINMAITAINSHVVREIVKDCISLEPDLLVVYMGNNEVVGPYGAGTVFGRVSANLSLIRAGIWLKTTRLGQLLGNLVKPSSSKKTPGEWRGLEMFLEKQVRADDPGLQYVYGHFQRNLEDIRDLALKNHVKVIFSTMACNLKDNPPFGSLHRANLAEQEKQQWNRHYRQGVTAETEGRFAEAVTGYLQAEQIDDTYSEMHYRLGTCYWRLGEYEKAKARYTLARDFDTLRFRADSRINQILRQVAETNPNPGVRLADAVKAFADNSPHDVLGEELFYEHVHFNFSGNYVLAKTIFQQVRELLPPTITAGKSSTLVLSENECAARLAYTPWDRFNLAFEMLNSYIKKPPYNNQLYHRERVERLEQELKEMSSAVSSDSLAESAAQYRDAIQHWPNDWRLHEKYAQLLFRDMKQYPEAEEQYKKVKEYLPHSYYGYAGLGYVLQLQGRYPEAVEYHREALRIDPYKVGVHNNLAVTFQALGQKDKAEEQFEQAIRLQPHFVAAWCNLGLMKDKLGQVEEAVAVCRRGLEMNPKSWALYYHLGLFLKDQGKWDEALEALNQALKLDPGSAQTRELLNQVLREKSKF